ncbi:Zn-ribbon domain-containing OB-fold protein [Caldilinea sp.]|uniref:Zn-ribbon domain-containing OB-fold protein n=1 Tax=Caldilinea sp. TaxID=2293560 RepID=UPI002BD56910|nr:Zn-ribbon domain-containing OB-fold protein [Anaerolineales bacterium]HQY90376.1 Zn-ribbon domain-containing OB-fold protein [Caldilinea sp.]HRA65386.1 Zn-ribbon domain-containing OB-fold protein [Caldilinea sp.]
MVGHLGNQRGNGGSVSAPLSGHGEVFSFTTMYNVPQGYEDQKPYSVALIKLDEGPMVTAQLTDVDTQDIKIGMRVEMVTRKLREEGDEGQIIYGYKFRPLLHEAIAR